MKQGFVYIMANDRPTLYVGVTNDLVRRVYDHKQGIGSAFTSQYRLKKVVYYEMCDTIEQAIVREKQLKDFNRIEKLELIRRSNPEFKDLFDEIK